MKQVYRIIFFFSVSCSCIVTAQQDGKVSGDYAILIDQVSATAPHYIRQATDSVELSRLHDPYEYLAHVYPHASAKQQHMRDSLLKAEREKDSIAYAKIQAEMQHAYFKKIEHNFMQIEARDRKAAQVNAANFWKFVGLAAAFFAINQLVIHIYKWAV